MFSQTAALIWFAVLLFLGPAWSPASARTDEVPKFDVQKSCRAAEALGDDAEKLAYKGCMQDEKDALQQLTQNWSHFKSENRRNCVAQGASPMPSYVEILTCLEMYEGFNRLQPGSSATTLPPSPSVGPVAAPPGETPVPAATTLDAPASNSGAPESPAASPSAQEAASPSGGSAKH